MRRRTVEYIVGSDLANLDCWIRSNGTLLDLSSGYTFSLAVASTAGVSQFTKTTDMVGDTGSGTETSGAPNLTITWETSGELNSLAAGHYLAELTITRSSDSRQYRRQFYLDMVGSIS